MVDNIFEFALMLDGREMGNELTAREEKAAKELGFVVVFGASDDLAEFRGALDDEVGCNNGKKIYLDEDGIFEKCKEECKYSKAAKEKCKVIEAVWCDPVSGFPWTYKTEIPHATFDIFEDGEPYCKGIVFELNALNGPSLNIGIEHSPLPWITFKQDNRIRISDSKGMCVSNENEIIWRQDAKYIVKACNMYPEIVEALQTMIYAFEQGETPAKDLVNVKDILKKALEE